MKAQSVEQEVWGKHEANIRKDFIGTTLTVFFQTIKSLSGHFCLTTVVATSLHNFTCVACPPMKHVLLELPFRVCCIKYCVTADLIFLGSFLCLCCYFSRLKSLAYLYPTSNFGYEIWNNNAIFRVIFGFCWKNELYFFKLMKTFFAEVDILSFIDFSNHERRSIYTNCSFFTAGEVQQIFTFRLLCWHVMI